MPRLVNHLVKRGEFLFLKDDIERLTSGFLETMNYCCVLKFKLGKNLREATVYLISNSRVTHLILKFDLLSLSCCRSIMFSDLNPNINQLIRHIIVS